MYYGTKNLAPNTNWHRMLTMLSLNGGTLYRAQMYHQKTINKYELVNGNYVLVGTTRNDIHDYIDTGGMPKMTNVGALMPLEYAYEERADALELVKIQRIGNRKYVTLLPKGNAVLRILDCGQKWHSETDDKQTNKMFRECGGYDNG